MFYSPEILSMRRNGKLSRCWLAGTLSDRLFKKKVSNKIVQSIDIQVTCNDILEFINSRNQNRYSRFSLYMSGKLLIGAAKLLHIQATLFQDSLMRIKADLNPIDLAPKKRRKRTEEIIILDEQLMEPPPVEFGDLEREDQHLLPEAQLEMIGDAAFRDDFGALPDFGALTDEELNIMLLNDGDIGLFAFVDRAIDASREQLKSPRHTEDTNILGISDALFAPRAVEESINAEIRAEMISTSGKRPSDTINLDTPTKRLRLRLFGPKRDAHAAEAGVPPLHEFAEVPLPDESAGFPSHEEYAGVPPQGGFFEIPPNITPKSPADLTVPQIDKSTRLPTEGPSLLAPPAQEHSVDIRAPIDSNLHLESPESDSPRPTRVRRPRIREIDKITALDKSTIGKSLFGNPSVYTIAFVPPVTDRKRGMLAAALLLNPTTNRRRSRAADSSKWAQELLRDFEDGISEQYITKGDGSMSAEALRLAESGMQTLSIEISKRHGETTALEPSSRNKTVEEPIPVDYDAMVGPVVPELPVNVHEPSMDIALANITDEQHILPNISEAQEIEHPAEVEIPPIPENVVDDQSGQTTVTYNANLLQSDVRRESVTGNGKSTSSDTDTFLPPKLRNNSVVKKEGQVKSSSREAIIDLSESPAASFRSPPSDVPHSTWNVPELIAYLEVLWNDDPIVELETLLPPQETTRYDAAACFSFLLQLSKERKVVLKQTEAYGTIYISKRVETSNMDVDEA